MGAADLVLSAADLKEIEDTVAAHPVEGQRYDEGGLAMVNI